MGDKAISTLFFGIVLEEESACFNAEFPDFDFQEIVSRCDRGEIPNSVDAHGPRVLPRHEVELWDFHAGHYCERIAVGFEIAKGDWATPAVISPEVLASFNTAVNVEAIRVFCERCALPFEDPRLLMITEYR